MTITSIDVISLVNAEKRRADFAEQARRAQSPWRFVDAATTASSSLPYDESRAVRRFGRALSPGEIGVFTSHHQVWKALLSSTDAQRIVLEDDVMVDWNTIDRLAKLDVASFGIDLVRFYATHPFQHRLAVHRFLGPHAHLVQVRGMFLGCQGYILTRRAAARLVELASAIEMPIDWLMTRYWEYGFPNYCIFPFPIIERYVPSNIGDRSEAAQPPPVERLVRFGWRLADRASRAYADHVRFRKNPFGTTRDAGPSFADRHQPGPLVRSGPPRGSPCGAGSDPTVAISAKGI